MGDYLAPENISYLADVAKSWLAYGIGLGAIAWMIGQAVLLIYHVARY